MPFRIIIGLIIGLIGIIGNLMNYDPYQIVDVERIKRGLLRGDTALLILELILKLNNDKNEDRAPRGRFFKILSSGIAKR